MILSDPAALCRTSDVKLESSDDLIRLQPSDLISVKVESLVKSALQRYVALRNQDQSSAGRNTSKTLRGPQCNLS